MTVFTTGALSDQAPLWHLIDWDAVRSEVKWLKRKYIRPTNKRNWNFHARYKDATGATRILDLLRMVDIARVRYIKIKGHANPYDCAYNQYFAMRSKASNIRLA